MYVMQFVSLLIFCLAVKKIIYFRNYNLNSPENCKEYKYQKKVTTKVFKFNLAHLVKIVKVTYRVESFSWFGFAPLDKNII